MPKRRQSSRRFAPSCIASRTNSRRCSIFDTSSHGMDSLLRDNFLPSLTCRLCPRTPVGYLSGLNIHAGHPVSFASGRLKLDGPHECLARGHSRHLFGDMTDTFYVGQVDCCDLMACE